VAHAVKEDQAVAGDDRAGEALADVVFPDDGRPFFRPGVEETLFRGGLVTVGAEELRPVGGQRRGRGGKGEQDGEAGGHGGSSPTQAWSQPIAATPSSRREDALSTARRSAPL